MFMKRREKIKTALQTGITAILGALLLLIMAVPVYAENEAVERTRGGNPERFNTVPEAFSNVQPGDRFTLLRDVVINESIKINTGSEGNPVILDLNGHGIRANATEDNPFSVITVENQGYLKIEDGGNETNTHYYIVNDLDTNGAGLATVCDEATYASFGGTEGTFTGGYITGGKGNKYDLDGGANDYRGGGIEVYGTLKMTGGTVIGNETKEHGGGIFANKGSYIEVENSTICGNRAGKEGGGIHAFRSRLVSSDSRITGNTAKYGGGIFLQNSNYSNEINNTVICGNKAALWGGGAYIDVENGSFTMNGGEICHNEIIHKDEDDESYGGGVHLYYGEFNMNGGRICNNKIEGSDSCKGGGVCVNANNTIVFSVSGNAVIKDNMCGTSPDNVFLREYTDENGKIVKNITVNGSLARESRIGVTTETDETRAFTSGLPGKGSVSNFFSDKEGLGVFPDDDNEAAMAKELTVTFNSNDGNDMSVFQTVGKDLHAALSANSFVPPSGSYFDGWAETESGKKVYGDGGTVYFTADTVFYARWPFGVTVKNGTVTGTGKCVKGETVEIKANDLERKRFIKWTTDDGVTFDNPVSATTTFTMPAKAVTVSATYEDIPNSDVIVKKAPEGVTGLKYNGGEQELITAGEAEGGTLLYALGESGAFGTEIPKAVEAGDYAVFWYVKGDAYYNDTEKARIDVSIGKAEEEEKKDEEEKKEPEKKPEKVPVSDPASSYASPEDNFAPVAPGSSEGTGGSIKKLELDFSKVKGSGVAPDSLKMTAVAGSKFTTKEKVKDKDSVTTEGGVKAKFNRKDSTVTISCKNTGKATFNMEDGDSYTVSFTVEKPKPNKNEAKLQTGTAPVTKTVKDLFGTSINGGKLTILKEKVSGQATLKGNELTVNPAEKDTIKLQYQYLNKKYKLSIKVK